MKHLQANQASRPRRVFQITLVLTALMIPGALSLAWHEAKSAGAPDELVRLDDGRGTPFKVLKSDNLCGLAEPRQLSDPAKVDYDELLQATDEYREMRDKKIDPASARGVELHNKAHSRIVASCERARTKLGHCSVWKTISRRNGKSIPDLTKSIKRDLAEGV